MRIKAMDRSCLPILIAVAILSGSALAAPSPSSKAKAAPAPPTVAILDPVDMRAEGTNPHIGDRIRIVLRESGNWSPMERGDQEAKLREYSFNPGVPCKEFQCGFDAGSVLQSEYVLFGTVTDLGRVYSYTFNLLHMASSQVVHSEVGEVAVKAGGDRAAALMGRLEGLLKSIDPARLSKAVKPKRGLMAVLDLSESSPQSRTMAERVTTHAYASRHFELISQAELEELLTALELKKSVLGSSEEALLGLGEKLGVSHLVVSRLASQGPPKNPEWAFNLALYDIGARRKMREWPAASEDFPKLLHFENRFFSTLTGKSLATGKADSPRRSRKGRNWRIALSGLGIAGSGTLGYLAYQSWRSAEREYSEFNGGMSTPQRIASRERTERLDKRTQLYGGLAALGLGMSAVLWTF